MNENDLFSGSGHLCFKSIKEFEIENERGCKTKLVEKYLC